MSRFSPEQGWDRRLIADPTRGPSLPDDLAEEAKKAGLNLSAVTQEAVRRTLAQRSTDAWLVTVTSTPSTERVHHDSALDALDAARAEAATRHG